jgi:hypothetical protein
MDPLAISTKVDLTGISSGMPQAAAIVEQGTTRIKAAFEDAGADSAAALAQLQAQMTGLQAKIVSLEAQLAALKGGHRGLTDEVHKSEMGMHLMGDVIGVKMPRMVRNYVGSLEMVAPVMAAAFAPLMAIEMGRILSEIPEALQKGIDKLRGWGEEAKKNFEETIRFTNELEKAMEHADKAVEKAKAVEGKSGSAKVAAEARLRDEDLAEALRKQFEKHQEVIQLSRELRALDEQANVLMGAANLGGGPASGIASAAVTAWLTQHPEREQTRLLLEDAKKEYEKARLAVVEAGGARNVGQIEEHGDLIKQARENAAARLEAAQKTGMAMIAAREADARRMMEQDRISFAEEELLQRGAANDRRDLEIEQANAHVAQVRVEGGNVIAARIEADAKIKDAQIKHGEDLGKIDQESWKRQEEAQKLGSELQFKMYENSKKLIDEMQAKSLEKLGKDLEEETKAREIAAAAQVADAKRTFDIQRTEVEALASLGRITTKEKIQQLKDIEAAQYAVDEAAARAKLVGAQAGGNKEDIAKAKAEYDAVIDAHASALTKFNIETLKATLTGTQIAKMGAQGIMNAFSAGFDAVLTKQKSFGAAMTESFRHMADQAIMNTERMLTRMLIAAAIQKITGQKQVLGQAYESAAATYKNVTLSGIGGFFNPAIAAAEAAGVFAAVAAFASSFDQGGLVPKTQMSLVHGGESIYTERQTGRIEQALSTTNNNSPQYHFHQAPGSSPNDVTASTAVFQRMFRDGRIRAA